MVIARSVRCRGITLSSAESSRHTLEREDGAERSKNISQSEDTTSSISVAKRTGKGGHPTRGGLLSAFISKALFDTDRAMAGPMETLVLEKALKADQFFHFRLCSSGRSWIRISRPLLFGGRGLGAATLQVRRQYFTEDWVCPYFDPERRTLRFRQRGGKDAEYTIDLSTLAQGEGLRPLLALAHAEGLLDKIPGEQRGMFNLAEIAVNHLP